MLTRKKKRKFFVETLGSPILKACSAPITEVDDELCSLAGWMVDVMHKFNGIGLAAPQIGRNIKLVVLDVSEDAANKETSPGELALLPQMPLAIINPEIVEYSAEMSRHEEGCLSVPGVYAEVERPKKIRFKATLLNGDTIEYWCDNMLARCIQHELDHLQGIMFVDKLDKAQAAKVEVKVKNLRREGGRNNYRKVLD